MIIGFLQPLIYWRPEQIPEFGSNTIFVLGTIFDSFSDKFQSLPDSYLSKLIANIVSPQAESAPEPAPPAPEPSAPPVPASGGAEEEEVDKVEVDKVDEPLTFSPMAEEASEAGAIPMAANAIRQEAEMAHSEAIS